MTQKVKLNAAQVIKHMSEKELKQYKIQLEKEGKNPPPSIPDWFKSYAQKINLLIEERNKTPDWFKPYAQKINLLMEERNKAPEWFKEFKKENDARWLRQEEINNKTPEWFKEFYKEFKEFKGYVLDQFSKHGWTK